MARYDKDHKETTRQKILRAASKEFRSHGYEGATVPGIMETAGLTAGGFYKHFDSKQELFAEVAASTLRESTARLGLLSDSLPEEDRHAAVAETYLSSVHLENLRGGCVIAALAGDLQRCDDEPRAQFESALIENIEALAAAAGQNSRDAAWGFQAMLLGGLIMARSVAKDSTAKEILDACRRATVILNGAGDTK